MSMPQDSSASPPAQLYLIESGQTFSGSLLWQIQRTFYQRQSIDAWRKHLIPNYVTTNPVIAAAYARLVIAYLRDWQRSQEPLDSSQPVFIIELGAGPGRFAFYFLRSLERLLKNSPSPDLQFTYMMTDFNARNLDFWKAHPAFQRWVEAGRLAFTTFDAASDEGFGPRGNSFRNPLVVIANYCLDSLPADAFRIVNGCLHETRLEIRTPKPYSSLQEALDDEGLLPSVDVSLVDAPLSDTPQADGPYQEADFDAILRGYAAHLPDTRLLFPIASLRCLRELDQLSGGRMLLITGDKGYGSEEDLVGQSVPGMALHAGCFSLMVNFHALGEYIRRRGGIYLAPPYRPASLMICAYLLGSPQGGFIETEAAYTDCQASGGPDDFFPLMRLAERSLESASLPELLAILHMSGFDPIVFERCQPFLIKRLEALPRPARQEVSQAVHAVLQNDYDLGDEGDLYLDAAQVLYQIRYFQEAIEVLQTRLRSDPPLAGIYYNLALCFNELRDLEQACSYLEQSLALNPSFAPAHTLLFQLRAEVSRLSHH